MAAASAVEPDERFYRRQVDTLLDKYHQARDTDVTTDAESWRVGRAGDQALLLAISVYLDLPDATADGVRTILRTRRSPW